MCHYRLLKLILLSFLITTGVAAQKSLKYYFRHISNTDGLLHNEVLSIVQDGKGYIWVATKNGLQRYDGSRFTHYPDMLSHASETPSYGARMYADKKNNLLWITNNRSIETLDLGKNKLTVSDPAKMLQDSLSQFTRYAGLAKDNWFISENIAYYLDSLGNRTLCHLIIQPQYLNHGSVLASDSIHHYSWLVIGTALCLFEKGKKVVYSNASNPIKHPLLHTFNTGKEKLLLRYLLIDSKRNIWVSSWGDQFFKYDAHSKKIHTYSLSAIQKSEGGTRVAGTSALINCLLEDDAGTIWIGTENAGLLRYDAAKDGFDYCISEKSTESPQYTYKIFSLFQDKERNIWVGTDKGISIFNPYEQFYHSIRYEETRPSVLKSEILSCIQLNNGDLFIGTWGGGIAVYKSDFTFKKNLFFKEEKSRNLVWSFLQADDEHLYIGCQSGNLQVYNIKSGETKNLQPLELEGSTIRCMQKDKTGNILFGLHNGKIVILDKQQKRFLAFNGAIQKQPTTSSAVLNIFIDEGENTWVSTEAGFRKFDPVKRIYSHTWLPDEQNPASIRGKSCYGIAAYDDSTLAIGTSYGGVNFFNKISKTFSNLTVANGLPSNTVYAVRKDKLGYLWLTTDYGLCKISPVDKKCINYHLPQGLMNASFLSPNFYPLQDGRWLTFTTAEVISFAPEKQLPEQKEKPLVEITGFKVFDHAVFVDSLLSADKPILLSYQENFFTIEFAALNFSNQQQITYEYRLLGIDRNWVNAGTKRSANYTNLQPGNYVFQVKASIGDIDGLTSSFPLNIRPPFWKTWWFISLMFVLFMLLIYLFVKWRETNIKAIESENRKVQQLKAEQYRRRLEMEQIINYFSSSLIDKNTVDEVLWDVARNLIGRLGFVDCIMYLWNEDRTTMIQKAGYGIKGSIEVMNKLYFDVLPGQGVVGYVMQTKEPVVIADTSQDPRYRPDEMTRLSEITVPIIYNNEIIGVIDSEHPERNFYTADHLQVLSTIATLMANKIKSIETELSLQKTKIEIYSINEQLSNAKLDALRSQMNPHFIFNCINSIDAFIHSNEKYNATLYLNKFAKLLRNILDSSKQNTVSFSKDVETLLLYIQLEELRHENKFKTHVNIDSELLDNVFKVPPLIIQPFVENAILHGLKNKTGNDGILTINVKIVNDRIQYIISDNGIGREAARKIKQNKDSHYGMQISFDRIKLFNKEDVSSVEIIDLFENGSPAGTEVKVNLNII